MLKEYSAKKMFDSVFRCSYSSELCVMIRYIVLLFFLSSIVKINAQVKPYSIVINEILSDPSPIVALPNCEFIELRNCTNEIINLNKWKISNGTTTATIAIDFFLKADSLVILCARSNVIFFNGLNNIVGMTSFPTLANEEGMIVLSNKNGETIHAVSYKKRWHDNTIKVEGGWSLEMSNPFKPCNINNWHSSKNIRGGTPGGENSIFNIDSEEEKLTAIQCISTSEKEFILKLNKGADSSSLSIASNYKIESTGQYAIKALPAPPIFDHVKLILKDRIENEKIYRLTINNIKPCTSDIFDSTSIHTGIAIIPSKGDLIINELLFNPEPYGADFLEVYNNSKSVINAKDIYIAGKNSAGQIGSHFKCAEDDLNIFPGKFLVITTDSGNIIKNWKKIDRSAISEIKSMPSYPDNEGSALLINKEGIIIDEFNYSDDMHYPLLIDKEGVSLERINPILPASLKENWHSASSSVYYATPTKENSQFRKSDSINNMIEIIQTDFSPNNDGINDFININYKMSNPGNSISIYAFNFNGMMIRKIADNQLCGTSGTFIWDGLNQHKQKVNSGIYIILAEVLDLRGKQMRFKKAIAVE